MPSEETDIARTAEGLGVTLRTLRFYEQIGLVKPQRRGTARIYSERYRIRLQLIGTGKRLGLSLAAIRDLIEALVAAPPSDAAVEDDAGPDSMAALMTRDEIELQLQMLERQLADVRAAIADLEKANEVDRTG